MRERGSWKEKVTRLSPFYLCPNCRDSHTNLLDVLFYLCKLFPERDIFRLQTQSVHQTAKPVDFSNSSPHLDLLCTDCLAHSQEPHPNLQIASWKGRGGQLLCLQILVLGSTPRCVGLLRWGGRLDPCSRSPLCPQGLDTLTSTLPPSSGSLRLALLLPSRTYDQGGLWPSMSKASLRPWLFWFSGWSISLRTKGSWV